MDPGVYQAMNIVAARERAKANAEWTVDGADVVHHEDGHGHIRYASKPWVKDNALPPSKIPEGVDLDKYHLQPFLAPDMDIADEPYVLPSLASEEHVRQSSRYLFLPPDLPWHQRSTTPQPSASVTAFPHPALSLPTPTLEFDFRMSVTLNPLISIGMTPSGQRNWISFSGGSWSGSFGSGTVVPGGQDSQIVHPNAFTEVVTHYLLVTNDEPPAYIVIKTSGWRTGPADVLSALRDPERADGIDPRTYKFRLFITMETGDYRYEDKVNAGMWIGSGMRKGAEVIYDAFRIS